jgi:hypothetical protein
MDHYKNNIFKLVLFFSLKFNLYENNELFSQIKLDLTN